MASPSFTRGVHQLYSGQMAEKPETCPAVLLRADNVPPIQGKFLPRKRSDGGLSAHMIESSSPGGGASLYREDSPERHLARCKTTDGASGTVLPVPMGVGCLCTTEEWQRVAQCCFEISVTG